MEGVATRACGTCGTENPASARFCMGCGGVLERACATCGQPAPAQAKFCMGCGAVLPAEAAEPAAAAEAAPPAAFGLPISDTAEERRTVTILFADLSGYTAISEQLDPEAVQQVTDRALRRLAREVERFGGTIDKYIGDNVMAIFGAPLAHEDDPERAVRAGFGMQEAMDEINAEVQARHGVRFQLRVGINTGEVLAGEVAGTYTVMGDAVNVAARLQSAGQPGSVTVGENTWRATRHRVEYVPLEPLTLKGKAEPVPAWEGGRLLSEPGGRPSAMASAPLVGRAEELALIESTFRRVIAESRPHLVTVVGEAGVGKSRILRELSDRLVALEEAPVLRQGRCLPYGSGTVYWALGEVLREECGIDDEDDAEDARDKLEARVQELMGDEADAQTVALLGSLLGMDDGLDLDPQRRREAFLAAARALIEGMAGNRPLVLIFEDIHWADNGLLDLVEHVAQWARGPVLIVALARDELLERRSGWGSGRRTTNVTLHPLTIDESAELVRSLLGADVDATAVAERSGGNPLFAEEMVRRLSESAGASVAELPDTVHAVLAARLDALPAFERRLLQQAAVMGRTFWALALAPLAEAEGADLQEALDGLADRELIVPGEGRPLGGEPELAFKHVLIRDVAYGMLPRAVRARKHFEVGSFVERHAGDRTDEVAPLLAEHYGRSAVLGAEAQLDPAELEPMRSAARRYVEAAGDAAARLFSNEEAFEHYAAAVALLGDGEEDARARIADKQGDVALRLGRVDAALAAWRSCLEHHRTRENLPLVGGTLRKIGAALTQQGERRAAIEHYQQGMNLLKDGPPSRELVRLYEDAAWLYVQSGDNMLAIYASEKALRLARQLGEAAAVSRAHGIFGRVFSRIGDVARARENLEKAVELARDGTDPLEEVLALLALANHLEIAEADYLSAEATYAEALTVAERVGDVPSQVELHAALAQLAVLRADWEAVRDLSASATVLAERAGLVLKLCLPRALEGLLHWRDGDWEEAEASYRRAAELAAEVGWSDVQYAALYGLALTLRDNDDPAGALEALDAALEVTERAGLTVQSIQALANKAVVLVLSGRQDEARPVAEEAMAMTQRLRSPVGEVAALEAEGATTGSRDSLERARDGWEALGRPLDAARSELLCATVTGDRASFEAAAATFEALGVGHLAGRARELALD